MSLESFSRNPSPDEDLATFDDFADHEVLSTLLKRFPKELRDTHAGKIGDMSEEDAIEYLESTLGKREEAVQESVVSDQTAETYFAGHEAEIWKDLETTVFTDTENFLGKGQTARIKRYDLKDKDSGKEIPLAIKYLLTPTEKTLSVSGEHDLILEVERIRDIERAEDQVAGKVPHLRVPHPYFYHKNRKIQCYGMELVDGINLEEGIEGKYDEGLQASLREKLSGIDREALFEEVEYFFDAMHTVCLHGDMKPANMMISKEGRFYVIDFGQSVLMNDVPDKAQEALSVLKEDDKKNARAALTQFLNALGV